MKIKSICYGKESWVIQNVKPEDIGCLPLNTTPIRLAERCRKRVYSLADPKDTLMLAMLNW